MRELRLEARNENLDRVLGFLEEDLEPLNCPRRVSVQLHISAEEIFVNICNYAYKDSVGMALIRSEVIPATETEPPELVLTFIDQGVPFNPLEREDPDVTLSGMERKIGGLGIYMVKKRMDQVTYEYRDGSNMLTIHKRIAPAGDQQGENGSC
ncbi:MAG: ATP-binding protein [Lachnospiraceae bacterium]|nr:ATP-binding protein [Lachnospiraceae bacterium]